MESKVIRLLSIIHNGIILDLFFVGFLFWVFVRCCPLLSQRGGIFPSYIVFFWHHVVLLENHYFSSFSREFRPLVNTPEPHGSGSFNLIGPSRSNNKPSDPRTVYFPQ